MNVVTSYSLGGTVTGERDELIGWLLEIASGCMGSDGHQTMAQRAAVALRSGAMEARAGHTVYYVEEG